MELNRDQIIKALECLLSTDDREFCEAKGCLFADCDSCVEDVLIASLALINELTEEIEALGAEKEHLELVVEGKLKRTSALEKQVLALTEENERLRENNLVFAHGVEKVAANYYNLGCADTVREMQKRLHERKVSYGNITFRVVPIDDIDQIAEEMMEDTK